MRFFDWLLIYLMDFIIAFSNKQKNINQKE